MGINRILIAVDEEPIAADAADVGADLARSLGAQIAFIYVIDGTPAYGGETGVAPDQLIASARQDGKKMVGELRQRLSLPPSTLDFVQAGMPSTEIVSAAIEWSADLSSWAAMDEAGCSGLCKEVSLSGWCAKRHVPS